MTDHARAPAAYSGWDPYLFVAYAHADAEVVHAEIGVLQQAGHRVAYDEGISPGSRWSDSIADRIERCSVFLFFVSPQSVRSEHCRRELGFAVDEGKDILAVHLEQTVMPAGVRLSLNSRQAILRYALDEPAYQRKLRSALEVARGQPEPVVAGSTAGPAQPLPGQLDVSVVAAAENPRVRLLVDSTARYIRWQGGVFRVLDRRRATHTARDPDYQLDVGLQGNDDRLSVEWQLTTPATGEIVWASRISTDAVDLDEHALQIAEGVGEGTIKVIADLEIRRTQDQPLDNLRYGQLMLIADQLNYPDPDQQRRRLAAIALARTREPHAGYPAASHAALLAWRVINGLSDAPDADRQLARSESRHALRLDGNDPAVLLSVGTTYCRMGDYDAGLSLIRRCCELAPTLSAKGQLARSLCFAGQASEAVALFEEIIAIAPSGFAFPYVRLAIAYVQAGNLQAALSPAVASTVNYPQDYYGWFVLANLYEQIGRTAEALEALREGVLLAGGIKLSAIIAQTRSTYGRTPEQKALLTDGLVALQRLSS